MLQHASPYLPPYTVDLRPFLASSNTTLVWAPSTPITLTDVDSEFEFTGTATLLLTKTIQGFTLTGTVQGKALVPCSQCIAQTWYEDAFELDEAFMVKTTASTFYPHAADTTLKQTGKIELHEQDFEELVDPTVPFALGDVVRQVIITQLPIAAGCFVLPPEVCPQLLKEAE